MSAPFVRAPASSANLGAGFDVFGMAVSLYADVGLGPTPGDARRIDTGHPVHVAFERLGGEGELWMRTNIPMARGLGFSGAVRVAAACLGAGPTMGERAAEILAVTTELEGHGDNVAASLHGGLVAYVEGQAVPFPLGPVLGSAAFIAWIPEVTTSTDASRKTLPDSVDRRSAVHNIGRAVQFALAFAHDDPELLHRATDDELHQSDRLPMVPNAAEAIEAGTSEGAWCGWLSGSGPTVGFLSPPSAADSVAEALPDSGHVKVLSIDAEGARPVDR